MEASSNSEGRKRLHGDGDGDGDGDGKSHLRAMYKMILRLQKGWKGTMRLKDGGGMAWQDEAEGKGTEECMERWVEVVGEGWGI